MRRDTWQALRSRVVFVNAPLERSESDSSARIEVSILRKISIGTVQIFQYRYLSKYRYFWQHYCIVWSCFNAEANYHLFVRKILFWFAFSQIQSWSKISAPMVNMIKEGCENVSALLILFVFYLFFNHKKSNLSLENKILKWGEISLWNKCFSQIHIGHN